MEKQVPEGDGEAAFPLFNKENSRKKVKEEILKAEEDVLEGQLLVQYLKSVLVPKKEFLRRRPRTWSLRERTRLGASPGTAG